jgi:general L-amino acid transport system substrate-binding protein
MPTDLPNPSFPALPSAAGRTRRPLSIPPPRARSPWSFRGRLVARTSLLLALAAALAAAAPAAAQTLNAVRERGALVCGVSHGLLGFSSVDDKGNWSGFDVDLCRALAAAIFDDAGKVKFVPLDAAARFAALRSGDIDVLSRNSTWTMSRETAFGLMFAAVTYYDGQGFLVRKTLNVESALELDGKSFCLQTGTTGELNVADYFRANNMTYSAVELAGLDEILKAYDAGRCEVFATDVSQLHAERLKLAKPDEHVILPDVISKEPLGPVVRQGDDQWFTIVKWTHFAMVNAEELGVSSKTIDRAMQSEKPEVKRLVGTAGNFGELAGLTNDWAARIVRLVGNYGEVFERNIGTKSSLGIPRGLNHLWTMGGIQYAPPIR